MSNDEVNPLDALESEESAKAVASTLERAAANGIAASVHGIPQQLASDLATISVLAALGGNKARLEDSVQFGGTKFVVPEQFKGNIPGAVTFLKEHRKAQATKVNMVRVFPYRPYDVAHALHLVLAETFGFTGNGEVIQTPFGPIEPEMVEVKTGIHQTVQVPYNRLKFVPLQGHIDIGRDHGPTGWVGEITVHAPKGFRDAVEGLFKAVEIKLQEASIYRGKAFSLDDDDEINFLDLSTIRREDVVYSPGVMSALESSIWVVIRNMEALRNAGQPVKRTVLLSGPYGTGKSLAGFLTGLECIANGVTFIFVKPGADLNEAMQTAQLYAPALVFFEDIDVLQSQDPEKVSKLLDTFDGISSKGKEIMVVMTTNHPENIHQAMLRPGRVDTLINVDKADRNGLQLIIEAKLRNANVKLDVDFDQVFEACDGYMPAFVGEVATMALRTALVREGGMPSALATEDFVAAADGLRDQFNRMSGAYKVEPPETVGLVLRNMIAEVLEGATPMRGKHPAPFFTGFTVERR